MILSGGIDLVARLGHRADDGGACLRGQALGCAVLARRACWRCSIGLVLGFVNGVLTAYLRIPSFITTLAALSAFRGIAFMFNNGSPVCQVSPWLEPIFYGRLVGLAAAALLRRRPLRAAFWFLRYTALGRSIYAVGGNANAARLSGIDVARVQLFAFVIAGFCAALGAVLMAAR